jgi:hypothetical protein
VYAAVLPHASTAVHVLVTIRLNPVVQLAGLSVEPVIVTVGVPHASDAVGATEDGIDAKQSRSTLAGVVTNTGAVLSAVHLTVREVVDVLLQPSLAVNVLVCERRHPLETTAPSDWLTVTAPQTSVAEALPNEPSGLAGLQPRFTSA